MSDLPGLADRGWYFAVEFRQSSSARFEQAVAEAGKHPGFVALLDEAGGCVYRTLYRADQLSRLPRLLSLVGGWKDTRLYLCGREVELVAVDGWLPCFLHCRRDPHPICRQPLRREAPAQQVGCVYAGISLQWRDWDAWFGQGRFDGHGVFHLDKGALHARIDSWEALYGGCPYADPDLLRRVVAHLPDTIDPRADGRWLRRRDPYFGRLCLMPHTGTDHADFLREQMAPLLVGPEDA